MLPKQSRLKRKADFKRVYRKGNRLWGFFLDIIYLSNYQETRFGLVVTVKTIKKASRRNKVKRIIKEAICRQKENWPTKTDLVIRIKREVDKGEKEKLNQELAHFFKRIDEQKH